MLSITVRYSIFNGFLAQIGHMIGLSKMFHQIGRFLDESCFFLFLIMIERKNLWLAKEDQKRINEEMFARRELKDRMGKQVHVYTLYC